MPNQVRKPEKKAQAGSLLSDLLMADAAPQNTTPQKASDSNLDLVRAPYALYGVKNIDLVSL